MNWGTRIIIAFVAFFGVIFSLAYICMQQDISLVADNYYEQELAYEDQMERIKNTNGLAEKPDVNLDRKERQVHLTFPENIRDHIYEGSVYFFRPSNARLDQTFTIQLDETGLQTFDLSKFPKGLWRVKVSWKSKNQEFYDESDLVL